VRTALRRQLERGGRDGRRHRLEWLAGRNPMVCGCAFVGGKWRIGGWPGSMEEKLREGGRGGSWHLPLSTVKQS
jgi:hypothetical protein